MASLMEVACATHAVWHDTRVNNIAKELLLVGGS